MWARIRLERAQMVELADRHSTSGTQEGASWLYIFVPHTAYKKLSVSCLPETTFVLSDRLPQPLLFIIYLVLFCLVRPQATTPKPAPRDTKKPPRDPQRPPEAPRPSSRFSAGCKFSKTRQDKTRQDKKKQETSARRPRLTRRRRGRRRPG